MRSANEEEGLSLRDIERFFFEPYGLQLHQLAGFPPASISATKSNPNARWSCADLLPWLQGFFRGLAMRSPLVGEFEKVEAQLRPTATAAERQERAVDRYTSVAVARVLMKQLPP